MNPFIKPDEFTRRQFLSNAARTYLGVHLFPMVGVGIAEAAPVQIAAVAPVQIAAAAPDHCGGGVRAVAPNDSQIVPFTGDSAAHEINSTSERNSYMRFLSKFKSAKVCSF